MYASAEPGGMGAREPSPQRKTPRPEGEVLTRLGAGVTGVKPANVTPIEIR